MEHNTEMTTAEMYRKQYVSHARFTYSWLANAMLCGRIELHGWVNGKYADITERTGIDTFRYYVEITNVPQ